MVKLTYDEWRQSLRDSHQEELPHIGDVSFEEYLFRCLYRKESALGFARNVIKTMKQSPADVDNAKMAIDIIKYAREKYNVYLLDEEDAVTALVAVSIKMKMEYKEVVDALIFRFQK